MHALGLTNDGPLAAHARAYAVRLKGLFSHVLIPPYDLYFSTTCNCWYAAYAQGKRNENGHGSRWTPPLMFGEAVGSVGTCTPTASWYQPRIVSFENFDLGPMLSKVLRHLHAWAV